MEHHNDDIMEYANVFVAIMNSYPEVAKLRLDRNDDILYLTFLLKPMPPIEEIRKSAEKIGRLMEEYHQRCHSTVYQFTVELRTGKDFAMLEIGRDIDSLEQGEATMIIQLFREELPSSFLTEPSEEDWAEDNEVSSVPSPNDGETNGDESNNGNQIIVYRKAGKVFVLNN